MGEGWAWVGVRSLRLGLENKIKYISLWDYCEMNPKISQLSGCRDTANYLQI